MPGASGGVFVSAVFLLGSLVIFMRAFLEMKGNSPHERGQGSHQETDRHHPRRHLYVAGGCKWSKDIADYVRWSEQMDLWCKMRFFGKQLEEEILAEEEQVSAAPQNLLALLPSEFTYDQFVSIRAMQGRRGDGKSTLRVWKHRGYIEYDEASNTWHKATL